MQGTVVAAFLGVVVRLNEAIIRRWLRRACVRRLQNRGGTSRWTSRGVWHARQVSGRVLGQSREGLRECGRRAQRHSRADAQPMSVSSRWRPRHCAGLRRPPRYRFQD